MRWETGRAVAESGLPPASRLVLVMLAEHLNREGESFPGRETLAEETGYSVRQVSATLAELEREGWVTKVRGGQGRGHAAVYRLNLPGTRGEKRGSKGEQASPFEEKRGSKGEQASPFEGLKGEVKGEVKGNETENTVPLSEAVSLGAERVNGEQLAGELVNYRELVGVPNRTTPPLSPPSPRPAENWALGRLREFLGAYPDTADKPSPRRLLPLWTAVCGGPDDYADIMAGLVSWKQSARWTKDDGRYICKPETFLTERRWEAVPGRATAEAARPGFDNGEAALALLRQRRAAKAAGGPSPSIIDVPFQVLRGGQ